MPLKKQEILFKLEFIKGMISILDLNEEDVNFFEDKVTKLFKKVEQVSKQSKNTKKIKEILK